MRKGFWFSSLVVLGVIALFWNIQTFDSDNYVDPEEPFFNGSFAVDPPEFDGEVTAVTYNIKYAQDITGAIQELNQNDAMAGADIIMLQEMDEEGVAQIAEALKLNYVYFPGAIHPQSGINFGPAILSPWPLTEAEKLILPHKSFTNGMQRIATKAIVQIPNVETLTYSVHTETILSLPYQRHAQFETIANTTSTQAEYVVVGGDFNTVTTAQINKLDEIMATYELERASAGSGPTAERFNVEAEADHIYTRGFKVEAAGRVTTATASDHLPVWVRLTPE